MSEAQNYSNYNFITGAAGSKKILACGNIFLPFD
jgi:hypothetical protein